MIDDERLYELIGERLREARERKRPRVTQEDLGRIVELERSSISNIESGKQRAPLHVLYHICGVLGADVKTVLPAFDEVRLAAEPVEEKQAELRLGHETRVVPEQVANIVKRLK